MIDRDGYRFVIPGLLIALMLFWAAGLYAVGWLSLLGGVVAVLTGGVVWFFRDPRRTPPVDDRIVVSPGDGRIDTIEAVDHPFVGPGARRISLFLSIFDVHVNRLPMSGLIERIDYRPGSFGNAMDPGSSARNEQSEIWISGDHGERLAFRQVAGLIARRIVTRLAAGDHGRRGDRCGLIRFGSRCDLIIPGDAEITVRIGETVRGGESALARMAAVPAPEIAPESDHA